MDIELSIRKEEGLLFVLSSSNRKMRWHVDRFSEMVSIMFSSSTKTTVLFATTNRLFVCSKSILIELSLMATVEKEMPEEKEYISVKKFVAFFAAVFDRPTECR